MDNEQEPKPGLMAVPVQVRQIIINILAHTPSDPPSFPSVSQQDYRLLKPGGRYFGSNGIWQRPPINPVLNMMLVNHQLHEEVKFCLEAVPQRYHLDVMNIKTYGLWTTWSISKMPKQQYIETVSCTFRLFEPTPDLDDRFADSVSFQGGCGGPPGGIWAFYALLAGLFEYGPGYCTRNPDKPRFVVGTIVLDFLAPTDGAIHSSVTQPEAMFLQRYMRWQGTRGDRTAEEALAGLLSKYLGILLNLDYDSIRYGRFLWESILDRLVLRSTAKITRRLMLSKSAKLTNLTSSSSTGGGTRSGCWNDAKWLGTGKKWTTSAL
ncbi:hypothetical protein QBC37DRAFT_410994 [Rhypophila decipiens]|uniref:Uncharacterized protein n=1 Tax=Rhypophila decipiens TaxID=261697 RepID=A0AAN6YIB0_9PEZI|nr:hypothetical protein QBC37DRAFT_410994 [Rhypophila decipiens]